MEKYHSKKHSIDFLFPVSLFFVFTITALYVTITGANLYQSMEERTSNDYAAFTALSYVERKIQAYDSADCITVTRQNGVDILCLHQTMEQGDYTTYIYTKDGRLMELFLKDGSVPDLDSGTVLMDTGILTIQNYKPQILTLCLISPNGTTQTLNIHLKTREGAV